MADFEADPDNAPLGPVPQRHNLLRFWFGLTDDVDRVAYATCGFGLMVVKYAVEAGILWLCVGRIFTPLDFLNPLLSLRQEFFEPPAPEWLAWVFFVWTVPFLWISVSMSIRRATNAGMSSWFGLVVLVPFMNYFGMIILCLVPHRIGAGWVNRAVEPKTQHQIKSALGGVAVSLVVALGMVMISVYGLEDYGVALFLGTPIWMGAVSAFLYNRPFPRTFVGSMVVAEMSIVIAGGVLLLFAFEGIICLAMLFPVAAAMGLLGGLIGYVLGVSTATRGRTMTMVALTLPCLAGAESFHRPTPVYEVVTKIEIAALPEQVWPFVVGFSDLPEPDPWYFKLGIAYPRRATIDGNGPGAVRHCEFSTGPFVEPITVWQPPERLAFDVASQPPPMHELSPYRHVHPPHLDGYLRCRRGEFRLTPLPGGRTLLEGSTWYEFEMYPQDYWTLWSDTIIHRIHLRVLEHIKQLAESTTSK